MTPHPSSTPILKIPIYNSEPNNIFVVSIGDVSFMSETKLITENNDFVSSELVSQFTMLATKNAKQYLSS